MSQLRDAVTAFLGALEASPARNAIVADLELETALPALAEAPDDRLRLFARGVVFKCIQRVDRFDRSLTDLYWKMATEAGISAPPAAGGRT